MKEETKEIKPEDIQLGITDNNEIDEMPEPLTKEYVEKIKLKPKFVELLHSTVGTLPYSANVGTIERHFKVSDIFNAIQSEYIELETMNQIIMAISLCPYNLVRNFMHLLETPEGQQTLWDLVQV